MTETKSIAEVRCDYRDDETGIYTIDVYLTENDDEEGFTVATVDGDGIVKWTLTSEKLSKLRGYDENPIHEAIKETQEKQADFKQELIDKCLIEIKNDVASGDVTAIDELLKCVPAKNLLAYLPD
jgi:DNA-binding sugar fermentation-stimulating protein